jgi:hypothetical protein
MSNFSAIFWQEQMTFNEKIIMITPLLDFYSASSLKQQFADRHVAPLGHISLIPSQPVFALYP